MISRFTRLFLVIFCVTIAELSAQSVLNPSTDSSMVYKLSSLNQEVKLQQLIGVPDNASFVAEFDSLFGKWYEFPKLYAQILSENIDDWEIALFETRNKQLSHLKAAEAEQRVAAELSSLIEKSIKWNYWHLVLAYPILRSNNDTKFRRVVSLPRIMTDELDLKTIGQPNDLVLDTYRRFLPLAITYHNSKDKDYIKYADRIKLVKEKSDFAAKYIESELLDYYQATLIEENCRYLTAASAKYFISNVYNEKMQKHLLSVCEETLNRTEVAEKPKEKEGKGKLTGNLPTLMDLQDKPFDFSAYKGKVIYVDFWASWCGPCRSEFPKSREMHESLSDKEKANIVFLYISIDESLDAWKSAVKQLGLEEFGENGHSYEVSGRYGIRTIPRYMIIDQSGEIVDMEATRPSNPETLQRLLKLIEK